MREKDPPVGLSGREHAGKHTCRYPLVGGTMLAGFIDGGAGSGRLVARRRFSQPTPRFVLKLRIRISDRPPPWKYTVTGGVFI